ncbi:MAG: sulfatase-like hydrolase/transferase [candidate division Zixibacteria bacterium]|nr:sulfatase-like hydrolase/transferase [candidate division Zixibacteria bacterium]
MSMSSSIKEHPQYIALACFGAVLGSILGGVIEAVDITLGSGYSKWNLLVYAVGYYGFIGAAAGFLFGIFYRIFLSASNGYITEKNVFSISGSAMATFFLLSQYNKDISSLLGIENLNPIANFLFLSLKIIILFIALYLLFSLGYKLLGSMPRKPWLSLAGSFIVIFIISLIINSAFSKSNKKIFYADYYPELNAKLKEAPNVLFILMDTLRGDRISPAGYEINTPAVQKLADDGIYFSKTYANCNWTAPSIVSIFTSLIPSDHSKEGGYIRLPAHLPNLMDEFRNKGYYTICITSNPHLSPEKGFAKGFNEFYEVKGRTTLPSDPDGKDLRFQKKILNGFKRYLYFLNWEERMYADAQEITDRAIDWLNGNKGKRFFLYVHYMDPHIPYYEHPYDGTYGSPLHHPGGENLEEYSRLYDEEVEYADLQMGRIINYLKEKELYDSTLIVYVSDHGEELFEHYFWSHANSMFEEQIHVPLIIKSPFDKRVGVVDSGLVSLIDVAPTVVEEAGFEYPQSWQGMNVLKPGMRKSRILSQDLGIMCIRTDSLKWSYAFPEYVAERRSLKRGNEEPDPRAIYDNHQHFNLANDPLEKNNIFNTDLQHPKTDSIMNYIIGIVNEMKKQKAFTDTSVIDPKTRARLRELGYIL